MTHAPLHSLIAAAPEPHDAGFADDLLGELPIEIPGGAEDLLRGVFGCSPYLARICRTDPQLLADVLERAPQESLDAALTAFARAGRIAEDEDALNRDLRAAKRRLHLLVALSDIGGVWDLDAVSRAMSDGADAAIQAAFLAHARFMAERGRIAEDAVTDEGLAGLFIVALGKLGSRELNISSDVDLAVFFDRQRLLDLGVEEPGRLCTRLTRRAVGALDEQTADGYVARVDLRLRPDPASTPLALSVEAAANYYESFAQTWERAAWIKARACAGDTVTGQEFMRRMFPFVWRRSMDYGAVEEIENLMRQIEAAAGRHDEPAGFDLKRGPGGIRQIEFFAQTQQLLHGGRDASLRTRATLPALAALRARGDVDARTEARLREIYEALRITENRLQIIEDQQTHDAPEDDDRRRRLARLCGRESLASFDAWLAGDTAAAREICEGLFEPVERDPREADLIFDGPDPADATAKRLKELGFNNPEQVWETVRGWLIGKPRATRSERARRIMRGLAPRIVLAVAETGHPNTAFLRFSEFLNGLPAAVNILSMFEREPKLLTDIVDALGLAPRLAKSLASRPEALEAFVAPGVDALEFENLREEAQKVVESARDFEEALDNTRRFARETLLRVGIEALRDQAAAGEAGRARVRVAEALVAALLPSVRREIERLYGYLDARVALIGMGSFGAGEMTYASDIDLMMVYEAGEQSESVDGPRSLTPETWCARLMQRLVSALSVETSEGPLFNVDLQLRPSGNAGPVAVRLGAFHRYYQREAWTWEMMALTRARMVGGDPALSDEVADLLRNLLRSKRDTRETAKDVADMRRRLSREKPSRGYWDLKRAKGGQIDLEFTVQYLQLIHAHEIPDVLSPSLFESLNALADAHILTQEEAGAMAHAARLNLDLGQLFALAVETQFDPETAPEKLKMRVVKASGADSFADLEAMLDRYRLMTRQAYERIVLSAAG